MRERNNLILADYIANKADEKPDHLVITFEGGGVREDETRTYQQLFENGNRMAAHLIETGMAPGDRFASLVRNHPEFVECLIGASVSANVIVPIDPRTRGGKLAYTLNNSECRGIVCAFYSLPQVVEIAPEVPGLEWVLVLEDTEDAQDLGLDDFDMAQSFALVSERPAQSVDVRLKSVDDPMQILYTSGTTGDPKGVVFPNVRFGGAMLGGPMFLWEAGDRPYTGLSLTHGNAQLLTFAPSLGMDLPVVFSRRFTKSRLWDITRKYGCTIFNLLGGMSTAVYSEPEKPNDADNPVRMVMSAGMPQAIWANFEKRFDLKIFEMYGAIEGGMALNPPGTGPVGSFGKAPPNLEIRIVDEEGDECPPGELGELISRPMEGDTPRVEYFKNPGASEAKTAGGWLRSGDMCHRDVDGWLYFDFRKGGGIRHNGDFINPGFVEKVLAEDTQVTDVFVYGVAAASGAPGEKDVVGAVVAVDAERFDAAAVFAHCRAGLESNFVPSYLQVVPEIPKTASEKPQERFLLDRFAPDAEGVYSP
ncbi:MAG: AMP-binding protein [Pseudomonadales bacterium]|nr:AMP-binding protein [Pseudomonadales bacterium]MDP6472314.1 AMP-binding protein [Pseudomonadales bacterium]MDP6828110.1 AMP-binding protein [Pseudomonadales bacterium]MDP6971808.1 AMP-binding protein [Pseudomonadales bacterium]